MSGGVSTTASTLPPSATGPLALSLDMQLANALYLLRSLLAEQVTDRARIAELEAELAAAQTSERAACVELCQSVVTDLSAEGDAGVAWGALACLDTLRGRR